MERPAGLLVHNLPSPCCTLGTRGGGCGLAVLAPFSAGLLVPVQPSSAVGLRNCQPWGPSLSVACLPEQCEDSGGGEAHVGSSCATPSQLPPTRASDTSGAGTGSVDVTYVFSKQMFSLLPLSDTDVWQPHCSHTKRAAWCLPASSPNPPTGAWGLTEWPTCPVLSARSGKAFN